jgi:hypothetical protein
MPRSATSMSVPRDRLYATLLVTGLMWWHVDSTIDPTYGLLMYTQAYGTVRVLGTLPALFTVVLPVLAWCGREGPTSSL